MSKIQRYTIDVCEDCIHLKGEMCHTPECVFIRCTMDEVKQYLNMLLIAPIVDGERIYISKPIKTYAGMI